MTRAALDRFQMVNALIWAATVLGSAVVVKATDEFGYLLALLVAGSLASWAATWRLLVQPAVAPHDRPPW